MYVVSGWPGVIFKPLKSHLIDLCGLNESEILWFLS